VWQGNVLPSSVSKDEDPQDLSIQRCVLKYHKYPQFDDKYVTTAGLCVVHRVCFWLDF
jgi:hypothetical protein